MTLSPASPLRYGQVSTPGLPRMCKSAALQSSAREQKQVKGGACRGNSPAISDGLWKSRRRARRQALRSRNHSHTPKHRRHTDKSTVDKAASTQHLREPFKTSRRANSPRANSPPANLQAAARTEDAWPGSRGQWRNGSRSASLAVAKCEAQRPTTSPPTLLTTTQGPLRAPTPEPNLAPRRTSRPCKGEREPRQEHSRSKSEGSNKRTYIIILNEQGTRQVLRVRTKGD